MTYNGGDFYLYHESTLYVTMWASALR